MSIFERIEKVRAKPEAHRRRVTFLASAGITVVVAIIWVMSLSFTLSSPASSGQVAAVGASGEKQIATTSPESNSFLNDNKVKIIEGWKVITSQK